MYAGITKDGKKISKIKGFKGAIELSLPDLDVMLNRNHKMKLRHNKWFRSFAKGEIAVRDSVYTLALTQNKRKFVYEGDRVVRLRLSVE